MANEEILGEILQELKAIRILLTNPVIVYNGVDIKMDKDRISKFPGNVDTIGAMRSTGTRKI